MSMIPRPSAAADESMAPGTGDLTRKHRGVEPFISQQVRGTVLPLSRLGRPAAEKTAPSWTWSDRRTPQAVSSRAVDRLSNTLGEKLMQSVLIAVPVG